MRLGIWNVRDWLAAVDRRQFDEWYAFSLLEPLDEPATSPAALLGAMFGGVTPSADPPRRLSAEESRRAMLDKLGFAQRQTASKKTSSRPSSTGPIT